MCDANAEPLAADHVEIGQRLDLFHLGSDPAGMVYWHADGLHIVRKLEELWRRSMKGWSEVRSPIIYGQKIWEQSGHLDKFRENMYLLEHDGGHYGLKPMNCPAHLQIFAERSRSHKELPVRYCELGHVHRAEQAGAVRGLLRVRSFVQDDGHILCAPEQVADEVSRCLAIARSIYACFDMPIRAELSLRPDQRFGDDELWDRAEGILAQALAESGWQYEQRPGEGAFYGPKIDLHAQDRLGRWWQLGSVQLDYVLPGRFGVKYRGADNQLHEPVMIHRAAFGSLERFIGILLEHYEQQLPLWLNPRQIAILPVSGAQRGYADQIQQQLAARGYRASVLADGSVGKRIRQSEQLGWWDCWVVGQQEIDSQQVASRRWAQALSLVEAELRLQQESAY